ncbi:ubiquitin domain-containing protein DSK2a-like protein [Tanacetum coccineum]
MGVEGESTQGVEGGEINLNIRCSNGNKFSIRSSVRSSVVDFKDLLAQNCDVPANQQRLIYKGRILKDDQTLDSYDVIVTIYDLGIELVNEDLALETFKFQGKFEVSWQES